MAASYAVHIPETYHHKSSPEFPVPPKSEQIAIADFIDSKYGNIEKSVELKKHQLEKLEDYKKSLIFEYVTGKREVSCEFPSETSGKKEV